MRQNKALRRRAERAQVRPYFRVEQPDVERPGARGREGEAERAYGGQVRPASREQQQGRGQRGRGDIAGGRGQLLRTAAPAQPSRRASRSASPCGSKRRWWRP